MNRRTPAAAALCAAAIAAALLALPTALAGAAAGPQTAKCGKLAKRAAKQRCLAQNKANRIAFNQIKNSAFVGARGDGAGVEDVYCANGKFESRSSDSYGTGVSSGRSWKVVDAKVKQGGKWIDAFVKGSDGFEIALQRRGTQWRYGVASLGRILYPGDVEKTNAAAACRTLDV
jgi:hypothetical protein